MGLNWEQGIKGGIGGGLGGAGVGGPVGAAVGGGLGLLAGLFGGGENENDALRRQMLMDFYKQTGGPAPQAGPAAQGGYSSFRNNQSNLISRLEALASGQGPSLASQQFKEATDRNQAAQAGIAASGRGGPLAALAAQQNMGLLGSQAAQGAAGARIQEQQMALQQLGGNIQAGRGADESMNQFNAGQQNQNSWNNLNARLEAMGMDRNTRLQILSQLGGQNQQAQGPGLGDQIMAGGAGLYAMGAGNTAQNKMGSGAINGIQKKPGYPQWGAFGGVGRAQVPQAPTPGWQQQLPPGIGSGNNSGY